MNEPLATNPLRRHAHRHQAAPPLLTIAGALLTLFLALLIAVPVHAQTATQTATETPEPESGYSYSVQRGDSWNSVAQQTGVTVKELKDANPDAVRTNDWLIVGEELRIPGSQDAQAEIYVVKAGEGWTIIARDLGVTVELLKAANPRSVRSGDVLYSGERLTVPTVRAQATPEATTTVEATAEPSATEDTADVDPDKTPPAPTAQPPMDDADTEAENAAENAPDATPVADETAGAEEPTDAEDASAENLDGNEDGEAIDGQVYIVQAGESWNSIARDLDIPADVLQDNNPDLIRPGLVLLRDDEMVIPSTTVLAAAQAAATAAAAEEAATAQIAEQTGAATVDDAAVDLPACPAAFADYPESLIELLNGDNTGPDRLRAFLDVCDAGTEEGLVTGDWTGDELDDLAVVYVNPAADDATLESDLIVFNGNDEGGYDFAYRAGAAGNVIILTAEDINEDEQSDLVWTDTTCGASTCFNTVNIRSWTGSDWADWTTGNITMAYAEVELDNVSRDGQGQELVLTGGAYGSVGAGPQRSRTEIWGSVEGAPYSLLTTEYAASDCLYHLILDANRAFLAAPDIGFDEAETLYTDAIGNEELTKCWVRENELDELRSFSYFRLALIAGYQDLPEVASDLTGALAAVYPDSIYTDVSDVWLSAYEENGDAAAACQLVTDYVTDAPDAWQMLAEYGYANPDFTAADVCPILEMTAAPEKADADAADAAEPTATNAPATATPAATATLEPAEEATGQERAAAVSQAAGAVAATDTTDTDSADSADADIESDEETATDEEAAAIPVVCPENVDQFAAVLSDILADHGGDVAALDDWLRGCDALTDDRGTLLVEDLNADGVDDVLIMPTIVSDLGYGPGGSQGALLIYHGAADGAFTLAYEPEIYGQPTPLAADDLNDDGQPDIAWMVESCSTFCVVEVQMITWNGEEYLPAILPGATITEGKAYFEPIGSDAAGDGQALILEGGISGVPEGGLAVGHAENWQSVDGGPYQRLEWIYDREAEGNDCVGLRLVEADVALQAADVLGYEDAIDLYTKALDGSLQACSLFGLPADEELTLLQGLTAFRLLQAQTLAGETDGAAATMLVLESGQPDSDYTTAAATWLQEYTDSGDTDTACDAISSIFQENDQLWQITDQFGYNHPALAAEQICFRP